MPISPLNFLHPALSPIFSLSCLFLFPNFSPYLSFFFSLLLPNPSLLSPLTLQRAQGIEPSVTVVVDFPLSVSVTFFQCHYCGCFPSPPQVSLYLSLLFIYNYFLSLICSLWCLLKSVYCFWVFGCEGIWRTSAGHVRLLSPTEEVFPFFCLFWLFTWWESWGIGKGRENFSYFGASFGLLAWS